MDKELYILWVVTYVIFRMIQTSKIYPQLIVGKYRTIKNKVAYTLLALYLGASWLRWDRGEGITNQALLLDLPGRKFYLFDLEIWPEEAYYLTGALVLAALGLFLFTALFGRIWCGYTCPQTVFTDLFVKVEQYFQGDRNSRMKLDAMEWNEDKIKRKVATHITWLLISFTFAFGWVCYFYDVPRLVKDLIHFRVGTSATSWLLGLTASTYLFAGFLRQKVCTHMCPYGRFQSAMLDSDSIIVGYNDWRGEPRASKGDRLPLEASSPYQYGDCIDCGKCVAVCPMGIDIRQGLQMECIGCGLCVDACDSVMEKIGKPLGLISYDSINSSQQQRLGLKPSSPFFRMKTGLFAGLFLLVASAIVYGLLVKPAFIFTIEHTRGQLATLRYDGSIQNSYLLKLGNRSKVDQVLTISVKGLEGLELKKQGYQQDYASTLTLELKRGEEEAVTLFVKYLPPTSALRDKEGTNKILQNSNTMLTFVISDSNNQLQVVKQAKFIGG
jgi:cytochrome c oxidase accessory protein FixG